MSMFMDARRSRKSPTVFSLWPENPESRWFHSVQI
jgi:hypothetical protein